MKILLITEYFPPEIGAGSNRAYELSKNWVDNGADVTVLTGFPDYPTGIIPDEYKNYKFLKEEIDGIKIVRTFIITAPNKGFFRRILSYLSFMFSSIIQGTKAVGKQDIIIATSPPFLVGISAYIIGRIKKIPYFFEVRDLWPDSIVQLGQIKNKFIIKFLEAIELHIYKNAKKIISVTDSFPEIIVSKGIERSKIKIVKNGVDLDFFNPVEKDRKLEESLGIQKKFVVSYIGTLGLSHAIDKLLLTADKLKDKDNIVFLIIGDGAEKEKLIRIKKKLDLKNVIIKNAVPRMDLPKYYSLIDLVVVSLKNIELFKTVIPSKIFEIMALRKPILISVNGEARKIIEKAKAGEYVEPENVKDFEEKIRRLSSEKELLKNYAANGRKFVEEYFDRKKLAEKYLDIIHQNIK